MKLKYYLRGMGIGLIVTTFVLMIAFMMYKDQMISDDEIRERAAGLGMVMPEDAGMYDTLLNNNSVNNSAQPEELDADDTLDEPASGGAEDGSQAGKNDSQNDQAKKNDDRDDADKDDRTEKPKKEVTEEVELSIVGGEYSDIVSEKLHKAGLIEDAEDFNKYLADGGYDNLIQPGTYVIPVGADYDAIIKIITEREEKKD